MKKFISCSQGLFLAIFVALVLVFVVIGKTGNPTMNMLNTQEWKIDGPFEQSTEGARFALLYSMIENHSFFLKPELARLSIPDVAYTKKDLSDKTGRYVSLFPPGLAIIVIPGYLAGKIFGFSQVGTYLIVGFFAILNFFLLKSICYQLGAGKKAAIFSSFCFLFATPALAYSANLYQHHISTFMLLASIWLLLKKNHFIASLLIWFLIAISIIVDYPNAIMFFPIAMYTFYRFFSDRKEQGLGFVFKKTALLVASLTLVIIPTVFMFWYNASVFGNPLQLAGTLKTVKEIGSDGYPKTAEQLVNSSSQGSSKYSLADLNRKKEATGFFKTRNLVNGLYIHIMSPDRGIIYFAPLILVSLGGILLLAKRNSLFLQIIVGVILANILLYSMWNDPWGGWAFGSRYLIPTYAMSSILLAFVLTKLSAKRFFLFLIQIVFVYAVGVNVLGAVTSVANPPKEEVLSLERVSGFEQKYTWERNWDYLRHVGSKTYVYNSFFKGKIDTVQYFTILFLVTAFIPVILFNFSKDDKKI